MIFFFYSKVFFTFLTASNKSVLDTYRLSQINITIMCWCYRKTMSNNKEKQSYDSMKYSQGSTDQWSMTIERELSG